MPESQPLRAFAQLFVTAPVDPTTSAVNEASLVVEASLMVAIAVKVLVGEQVPGVVRTTSCEPEPNVEEKAEPSTSATWHSFAAELARDFAADTLARWA